MGFFEVLRGFFFGWFWDFLKVLKGSFGILWDPFKVLKEFLGWLWDFSMLLKDLLGLFDVLVGSFGII